MARISLSVCPLVDGAEITEFMCGNINKPRFWPVFLPNSSLRALHLLCFLGMRKMRHGGSITCPETVRKGWPSHHSILAP